ncbi:MAG: DUF4492 domain-containing protein [Thiovulaceae bacterium]|nr:DUF4492 domain-containing protein [Sulfurimonadaceae bacterium]
MKLLRSIVLFYKDGFLSMRLGKKLWLIIFLKLFILFAVVKLLFFPNFLDEKFKTEKEKSAYIMDSLTTSK